MADKPNLIFLNDHNFTRVIHDVAKAFRDNTLDTLIIATTFKKDTNTVTNTYWYSNDVLGGIGLLEYMKTKLKRWWMDE